jgi:hypothetical protein
MIDPLAVLTRGAPVDAGRERRRAKEVRASALGQLLIRTVVDTEAACDRERSWHEPDEPDVRPNAGAWNRREHVGPDRA